MRGARAHGSPPRRRAGKPFLISRPPGEIAPARPRADASVGDRGGAFERPSCDGWIGAAWAWPNATAPIGEVVHGPAVAQVFASACNVARTTTKQLRRLAPLMAPPRSRPHDERAALAASARGGRTPARLALVGRHVLARREASMTTTTRRRSRSRPAAPKPSAAPGAGQPQRHPRLRLPREQGAVLRPCRRHRSPSASRRRGIRTLAPKPARARRRSTQRGACGRLVRASSSCRRLSKRSAASIARGATPTARRRGAGDGRAAAAAAAAPLRGARASRASPRCTSGRGGPRPAALAASPGSAYTRLCVIGGLAAHRRHLRRRNWPPPLGAGDALPPNEHLADLASASATRAGAMLHGGLRASRRRVGGCARRPRSPALPPCRRSAPPSSPARLHDGLLEVGGEFAFELDRRRSRWPLRGLSPARPSQRPRRRPHHVHRDEAHEERGARSPRSVR